MELEDLADCQAEVTEPIKYTFKVGQPGEDGITLWEVSRLPWATGSPCSLDSVRRTVAGSPHC